MPQLPAVGTKRVDAETVLWGLKHEADANGGNVDVMDFLACPSSSKRDLRELPLYLQVSHRNPHKKQLLIHPSIPE